MSTTPAPNRMDTLSRLLRTLHVEALERRRLELRGPVGFRSPNLRGRAGVLVVVLSGELWVEPLDRPGARLRWSAGEIGLALPSNTFALRTVPAVDVPRSEDVRLRRGRETLLLGERGELTRVEVLRCVIDDQGLGPFARALPPALVSSPSALGRETIALLEQHGGRPGGTAVLERMAELLLVEAIAAHFQRVDLALGVVEDPAIAAAVALIQANLEVPWTVASLARRVAMSRTAFAARFTACVGEAPIRYLARQRLARAEHLLATTALPLAEIARRVGYTDAANFSRAYRRARGSTPGKLRSEQHAQRIDHDRALIEPDDPPPDLQAGPGAAQRVAPRTRE